MKLVASYVDRLRGSEFVRDTATLTAGTITAQLILIVALPFLSRLYTPSDFGVLAIFLAVSSISATVVTLRYETAILIPKEVSESRHLVVLSLALALVVGSVLVVVAWLLPDTLKMGIGVSVLGAWLPTAVVVGVASAVVTIGLTRLNRRRDYLKMAKLRVVQNGLIVSCGILLGVYGYSAGMLLGQTLAVVFVGIFVVLGTRDLLTRWNGHELRAVAREHKAAPKFLLPTALLDVVSIQLPVLVITAWFGTVDAGNFNMAWRVLALPMTLVGYSIGQVFFRRFSEIWPDARAGRNFLLNTWKTLIFVGLPPTIVAMLFAEDLFVWFLGDSWDGAGRMAVVLAPLLFVRFVSSPTSTTFLVLGMQKYSLYFGIAVLLYRPLCLSIGLMTGNLLDGLIVFAVVEILQVAVYQYLVLKRMSTEQ